MSPKVALLLIAILLGAAVGTLGLYFGTDLFGRDPLAGMEAQPITQTEIAEAAAIRGARIAPLSIDAEAPALEPLDPAQEGAVLSEFAEAVPAMSSEPESATAMAGASPYSADADPARVTAVSAAPPFPTRSVKRWKPSYVLAVDLGDPNMLTAEAPIADAAEADRQGAPRAASLRQPLPLLDAAVAAVVNDTRTAPRQGGSPVAWKTSLPLVADAAVAEAEDAAPAWRPDRVAPSMAAADLPAMVRDEIVLAEAPQADHVAGEVAARPVPRSFVEWKTSPALVRLASLATAEDDGLAAQPAPIDRPEAAPEAATIAIETVDFQDPDRVTISGLTRPHATVRVQLNAELLDETRSDGVGMWRASGSRELGGGRHLVRAEVYDEDAVRQASTEMRFERVQIVMGEELPRVDAAREAPAAQETAPASGRAAGPTAVHIERGDNLWHIARAIYGEGHLYREIYEVNRNQIRNPDLIYPGQVFTIPILGSAD